MKILAVEHFNSIFALDLIKAVKKISDLSFDLLTTDHYQSDLSMLCDNTAVVKINFELPLSNTFMAKPLRAAMLAHRRARAIRSLGSHDVCHIHFLESIYGLNAFNLRRCAKHLVVSMYGSDIYRTNRYNMFLQKIILNMTDAITFTNAKTSEDFLKIFGRKYLSKIRIINFGTVPIEKIRSLENKTKAHSKQQLGLPTDSIIVTCGYSADPVHQHIKVLESINECSSDLPESTFLLLPMTYGSTDSYKDVVKQKLEKTRFRSRIIDTFLSDEEVAHLRKATDIMINVPKTDQFSATMQEHAYAGNVVINGAWLPYDILYQRGLFALKAGSVDEVGHLLVNAIKNLDALSALTGPGKDVVWSFLSWEANAPKWIDLYHELAGHDSTGVS